MRSKENHRRIYKKYYGFIPYDAEGRPYDIHHLDNNHSNNDPMNLKEVSAQEHYDIHLAQGDHAACCVLAARIKMPASVSAEHSKKAQRKLVQEGRHHFLGPTNNKNRTANGINPFAGASGSRISKEQNAKRIANKTHNLLGSKQNLKMIAAGTHVSQKTYTCPHCGKVGRGGGMFAVHFDKCKKASK